MYATEDAVALPATSVAVTVNVFAPSVVVSSAVPAGTVPVQLRMPLSASVQEYVAATGLPSVKTAPSAGDWSEIVGGVLSITVTPAVMFTGRWVTSPA